MGKKFQPKRIPKFAPANRPTAVREPKIGVSMAGQATPVWRFSLLDWDGPWCPSKCKETGVREIQTRLAAFESMTWAQILSDSGSHTVGAAGLSKAARQRLIERNLDEWADHLTSLRMGAKERVWGVLRAGVFHMLWWDPEHEVLSAKKKNKPPKSSGG